MGESTSQLIRPMGTVSPYLEESLSLRFRMTLIMLYLFQQLGQAMQYAPGDTFHILKFHTQPFGTKLYKTLILIFNCQCPMNHIINLVIIILIFSLYLGNHKLIRMYTACGAKLLCNQPINQALWLGLGWVRLDFKFLLMLRLG